MITIQMPIVYYDFKTPSCSIVCLNPKPAARIQIPECTSSPFKSHHGRRLDLSLYVLPTNFLANPPVRCCCGYPGWSYPSDYVVRPANAKGRGSTYFSSIHIRDAP